MPGILLDLFLQVFHHLFLDVLSSIEEIIRCEARRGVMDDIDYSSNQNLFFVLSIGLVDIINLVFFDPVLKGCFDI